MCTFLAGFHARIPQKSACACELVLCILLWFSPLVIFLSFAFLDSGILAFWPCRFLPAFAGSCRYLPRCRSLIRFSRFFSGIFGFQSSRLLRSVQSIAKHEKGRIVVDDEVQWWLTKGETCDSYWRSNKAASTRNEESWMMKLNDNWQKAKHVNHIEDVTRPQAYEMKDGGWWWSLTMIDKRGNM